MTVTQAAKAQQFRALHDAPDAFVIANVWDGSSARMMGGGGRRLNPAFRRHRFRVGPDSAGADPGPACYRRVGPLTVSEANICVEQDQPAHFPTTCGPAADQPHAEVVIANSPTLRTRSLVTGEAEGTRTVAEGFLPLAIANWSTQSIRKCCTGTFLL